MFRTDSHNNPTAFTTDVAKEGGLHLGKDYTVGDPFTTKGPASIFHTARLIGDPLAITIRVIDVLGFYFGSGGRQVSRWGYITMPAFTWRELSAPQKRDVIGWMYQREGGETMRHLFPNYGKL